jgi:hypothetical protein
MFHPVPSVDIVRLDNPPLGAESTHEFVVVRDEHDSNSRLDMFHDMFCVSPVITIFSRYVSRCASVSRNKPFNSRIPIRYVSLCLCTTGSPDLDGCQGTKNETLTPGEDVSRYVSRYVCVEACYQSGLCFHGLRYVCFTTWTGIRYV